ncbi:MAG: hypothetical protein U5O15_09270 [Candidatus Krumholzibacteriota bacterium]|nr:hypothetical protein [Candidatus Krumholzibacteriota bacterium]
MGTYHLQTLILKILAVAFIMIIITSRPKKKVLTAIIFTAVMSLAVHAFRDGISGVYFSVSGIFISLLLTTPIRFYKKTSKLGFLYSAAAGAITGPLGSILVFIILFTFLAISKLFKSRQLMVLSNFRNPALLLQFTIPAQENLTSQLSRIEASRMDNENGQPDGLEYKYEDGEQMTKNIRIGPWKTMLAMSTLAVVIIGVFV